MSRPPGRGSALTPDERLEIQRLRFAEGRSVAAIARQTQRDRSTVAAVLAASDSQTLSDQLQSGARERVLQLLLGSTAQAVREWAAAMVKGAAKGDHRPSRDWLLHAGVIDSLQTDAPSTRVMIQIGTPERPIKVPSPLALLRQSANEDEDGST